MAGEFDHDFGRHIVSGSLREVIDDDWQSRTVCNRPIEGEQVRRKHLLLVIVRSADHGGIVAELSSVFGESQSFLRGFDSCACDHDLIGSSSGQRGFQHVAALLIGKEYSLAGRALNNYARDWRA